MDMDALIVPTLYFVIIFTLMLPRLILLRRMGKLIRKTNMPEWKAWRLSTIEPLMITLLMSIWLPVWIATSVYSEDDGIDINFGYTYADAEWVLWYGIIAILVCNLSLFARAIHKVGQLSPQSRLALNTIYVRLGLIALSVLFGLLGYFNGTLFALPFYALFIAFIIRIAFSIDQTITVTKKRKSSTKESTLIEDGLVDDQVTLIRQLKAEEVMAELPPDQHQAIADQMVAEKNITVGRAKELV